MLEPTMVQPFGVRPDMRPDMAAMSASHVSRWSNARANAEAVMNTRTIIGTLGLLAVATLLVADSAHAGRAGGGRPYPAMDDRAGDYDGGSGWSAAAAAAVAAKAAARAAYDAHDDGFLHRCYQPQRIWNGAYYTWRLVSIC